MNRLDAISKTKLKDFVAKNWLTHDGLWYYHAVQTVGVEKANALNKTAIRSLAGIETQRALQLVGTSRPEIDSFAKLRDFMLTALDLTMPSSINARIDFSSPGDNIIHWHWEDEACFAYKGVKLMGLLDRYACGVIYRIECWLEALDIGYTIEPRITACIMAAQGQCSGDIRILAVD